MLNIFGAKKKLKAMPFKPPSCGSCSIEDCFINRGCTSKWLSILGENKTCVHYKKGQNIIFEGNPVLGMYFIHSGKVKIFTSGLGEKKQTVRLAISGNVLGHRGYGGEVYPIGASALEDSWVCFLENDILYDAFMANPKFSFLLMMYYSQELRKTETRMKCLAQMTVREKVADALLIIKDVFSEPTDHQHCSTKQSGALVEDMAFSLFELSRKDLADIAGITSYQASRVISEFKEDKLIKTTGKKIILLDYRKLTKMISFYHI